MNFHDYKSVGWVNENGSMPNVGSLKKRNGKNNKRGQIVLKLDLLSFMAAIIALFVSEKQLNILVILMIDVIIYLLIMFFYIVAHKNIYLIYLLVKIMIISIMI